ncbi:inorganic phosphate transporter [Lichenibacterium dinghuense]|uniref:inorganic phosphate transporter n=1 Tax=Lichenibacterium dinghuense TaxID=2895977 RepID=UPI001F016195|nr:inorganic phosphate transporter [Lichenibacterium sp. 6Y81]
MGMLAAVAPGSTLAVVFLALCLALVLAFEFSNGFHDTANAVATVIYTHSLKPVAAVVWSGIMNFLGVLLGGIAVAYALVELIPPDVLSPPDGGIAAGMLAAIFVSALGWNLATWLMGIPNSSSHALIGALVGIAVEDTLRHGRALGQGVDWHEVWSVLLSLLVSPVLGFGLAMAAFWLLKRFIHDEHLYEPPKGEEPPVWWMRAVLIGTCTAVSFAHGTNDGQKSIGLIMLTIIGLFPMTYALNVDMTGAQLRAIAGDMGEAAALIGRYGDDRRQLGVAAARAIEARFGAAPSGSAIPATERPALRNDMNLVLTELKRAGEAARIGEADEERAHEIHETLMGTAQYVPLWVRVLSALCLGAGTMIGYKRIVTTLGEKLGKQHLAPAQGAAAEVVAAGLIGGAGFSGFPVSTTHVVTGGIAGTMVASGAGAEPGMLRQIGVAWILTLPATVALSAGLFYLLS